MIKLDKVLYRSEVTAMGGREGRATSSDATLDLALSVPKELGGPGRAGTNPEQLFAAEAGGRRQRARRCPTPRHAGQRDTAFKSLSR